jgi:hypothetical protein
MKKHLWIALALIPFLLSIPTVEAAYLDIAWSPNMEPDLAGYRVYYGTSSEDYIGFVDVGQVTAFRLDDLIDDATYYIALTAYDAVGNESGFSDEVFGIGISADGGDVPSGNDGDSVIPAEGDNPPSSGDEGAPGSSGDISLAADVSEGHGGGGCFLSQFN